MAPRLLQWLPERHLSVVATLAHADMLIENVADLLFEYQAHGDTLSLEEVRSRHFSQTIVNGIKPLPRRVPLLVADALTTLRAAIEHTLFTEVEFLHGRSLNEKAARLVEMPALHSYEEVETWASRRIKNGPDSLKPGGELVDRLSALQPFHRYLDTHEHPLARLVLHSNHAKHRTPAVTSIRLAAMIRDDETPRPPHDLPKLPDEPMYVGQVLAQTPLGQHIPVTLFPTIGINRPGTNRWPILMQELGEIADWVRTQAIPRLITGMAPQNTLLPARYEIQVGHPNERYAISEGVTVTAANQYKIRLSAGPIRDDFIGILADMEGAPTREQVSVWIHQLSDEEVLSKTGRIVITEPNEIQTAHRNMAVLEDLLEEAIAFTARD